MPLGYALPVPYTDQLKPVNQILSRSQQATITHSHFAFNIKQTACARRVLVCESLHDLILRAYPKGIPYRAQAGRQIVLQNRVTKHQLIFNKAIDFLKLIPMGSSR